METELKHMTPEPSQPHQHDPDPEPAREDGFSKDDHPLLKSDSNRMPPENMEELEKKFAAFLRNDVYGTIGRGELPLAEKVFLGFALVTLVPIRVVLSMIILLFYYTICRICTLFSAPNRDEEEQQEDFAHMGGWRRAVIVCCGRFLSRVMLFLFGFYWIKDTYRILEQLNDKSLSDSENASKDQSEEPERPGAIISNHVSYLDILYHMSSSFPSFVAKRSVAKLPLVGLISKCLGCVFVQRESKSSNFKGVAEGTTTNGDFLLPFKTGAFVAGAPVLPVILRYPYQRFSPSWDSIYAPCDFSPPSVYKLLGSYTITCLLPITRREGRPKAICF